MKNNIPSFEFDSMKPTKSKILNGILFLTSQLLFNHCWAALTGTDTATMNFTGIPAAVYGWANEINNGSYSGLCQREDCFVQNGIVAGVVKDPIDNSAHIHGSVRVGSTNAAAQYHPDSTGLYVRMADLSKFSLKSLYLDFTASGSSTGQIVIYGYSEAINPAILSNAGFLSTGAAGDQKFNPSDPEGGNVAFQVSYPIDHLNTFKGLIDFTAPGMSLDWSHIGAFWITFKDFNHSPTKSYPSIGTETVIEDDEEVIKPIYPYPNFDIRIDQITLGSACQPSLQITIH